MKDRILLVEDEKDLSKAVKTILTLSNYDVDTAFNGKEALDKVKEKHFDIIIMDIMMPVMDGIDSMKEMRKIGVDTPIILLTAKSEIEDKIFGLDSGANDYMTKPFDKKELLARIRALLRIKKEKNKKYSIGDIIFDKEKSELYTEKAAFHLTIIECDMLEILIKNKNIYIPAIAFEKIIWDSNENSICKVNMYISYLQNKFESLSSNINIIIKNNEYKLELIS